MGKSRAATVLRLCGVPVFDADAVVHGLTAPRGAAVRAVATAFPGSLDAGGGIDRQRLGRLVFADPAALRRLEAILHPMVRAAEGEFLRRCCRAGQMLAVLDIPLLLETGGEARVDRVVVVSAHPLLQRQRALRRPGMTDVKLAQIRAKQVPDATKRRRADYVIASGQDQGLLVATVRRIIAEARDLPPGVWPGRWLRAAKAAEHHAA
jgi:dephospho-CoA kinase